VVSADSMAKKKTKASASGLTNGAASTVEELSRQMNTDNAYIIELASGLTNGNSGVSIENFYAAQDIDAASTVEELSRQMKTDNAFIIELVGRLKDEVSQLRHESGRLDPSTASAHSPCMRRKMRQQNNLTT
jgi:hypothetical protein